MNDNSFAWFKEQFEKQRKDIAQWQPWMKDSARFATASFPIVHEHKATQACPRSEADVESKD